MIVCHQRTMETIVSSCVGHKDGSYTNRNWEQPEASWQPRNSRKEKHNLVVAVPVWTFSFVLEWSEKNPSIWPRMGESHSCGTSILLAGSAQPRPKSWNYRGKNDRPFWCFIQRSLPGHLGGNKWAGISECCFIFLIIGTRHFTSFCHA